MPGKLLTSIELDSDRLGVIRECMQDYDVAQDPEAEWPNNMISRRAVVFGSGLIARRGETVIHAVDPTELKLCQQLSKDAASIMKGTSVGMGSESGDEFQAFYIAKNGTAPNPKKITKNFILAAFGNTLFPLTTIKIEPIAEKGSWWSAIVRDQQSSDPESQAANFAIWRKLIQWFQSQKAFVDSAFVSIGDRSKLEKIPNEDYPNGTVITPCVLPRLAIGLTSNGSVAGLFGFVVQT